jgi:hypothetical protein
MRTGNTDFKRVTMCDTDGNEFTTRSGFEAEWAEYLGLLVKAGEIGGYQYEPVEYGFDDIKRGRGKYYTPDFLVYGSGNRNGYFVECKGYLDQMSYTKVSRFLKRFPVYVTHGFQLVMQQIPKSGPALIRLNNLRPLIESVGGRIIDARDCLRNVRKAR